MQLSWTYKTMRFQERLCLDFNSVNLTEYLEFEKPDVTTSEIDDLKSILANLIEHEVDSVDDLIVVCSWVATSMKQLRKFQAILEDAACFSTVSL